MFFVYVVLSVLRIMFYTIMFFSCLLYFILYDT